VVADGVVAAGVVATGVVGGGGVGRGADTGAVGLEDGGAGGIVDAGGDDVAGGDEGVDGALGAVVEGADEEAGGVTGGAVGREPPFGGVAACPRGCAQFEHQRASARFCVPHDGQRTGRSSPVDAGRSV
jgi:hypothetical protein